MPTQKLRPIYSISLVILDAIMIVSAFILAYQLRVIIPWPAELASQIPLVNYSGLIVAQVIGVITAMFFNGLYYLPRAVSRVDQFYSVLAAVTIGTMIAVAISVFTFKNSIFEVDYPRAMVIYAWVLTIILITIGRSVHQIIRDRLRDGGVGKDRLLIVGTGEVAQIIVQRVLWSPRLGYDLIGIVNGDEEESDVLGVQVLGTPEDLPVLIDENQIDEVIIAMPEKGHREVVRVISYCERGRVSIKVFPDFFQFIASEADIDDLGGLPLLSVRDHAMRGYRLLFKRVIDFIGAVVGIIILSPLMLITALAIRLESPGSVFFVQQRMGLDRKPFYMIKFRSMRQDAEFDGPGWTVADDPRRTKLGTFLRRIEVDELPQFINVLLGEMSLVGPRPEQPYYVDMFRESVPRYMERHKEKAGMTGWAQVNGLRGDTSIQERTRYDVWYTENWSIMLDIKIILRTFWQIINGNKRKI